MKKRQCTGDTAAMIHPAPPKSESTCAVRPVLAPDGGAGGSSLAASSPWDQIEFHLHRMPRRWRGANVRAKPVSAALHRRPAVFDRRPAHQSARRGPVPRAGGGETSPARGRPARCATRPRARACESPPGVSTRRLRVCGIWPTRGLQCFEQNAQSAGAFEPLLPPRDGAAKRRVKLQLGDGRR
jgi:hypothetical protein